MILNISYIIVGLFLLSLGTIGVIQDRTPTNTESEPKNGEVQVRKQGQRYWTYTYVKYPGWTLRSGFSTEAEAISERDRINELLKGEEVIK